MDGARARDAFVPEPSGGRRRRVTAHHEAGHALARLYLGHRFDRVVVRTVREALANPHVDGRGRRLDCEGLVEGYSLCAPYLTPEILGAMEGTAPGRREAVLRDAVEGAEMEMAWLLAGPAAEARYRRRSLAEVALAGGGVDDWRRARACAETWFRPDPAAALELAEGRARALVASGPGWRALRRLAEALVGRGVLECEEAEIVFAAEYGAVVPRHGAWAGRWPPPLGAIRSGRFPADVAS